MRAGRGDAKLMLGLGGARPCPPTGDAAPKTRHTASKSSGRQRLRESDCRWLRGGTEQTVDQIAMAVSYFPQHSEIP